MPARSQGKSRRTGAPRRSPVATPIRVAHLARGQQLDVAPWTSYGLVAGAVPWTSCGRVADFGHVDDARGHGLCEREYRSMTIPE